MMRRSQLQHPQVEIDCCNGCFRVWDEDGSLIATYYKDGSNWCIDFGDEHLFTVASELKATEWIYKSLDKLA